MATVSSTWRPLISSDTLMTVKKMFIVAKKIAKMKKPRMMKKANFGFCHSNESADQKKIARAIFEILFSRRALVGGLKKKTTAATRAGTGPS